jgi:VanZ family protein
VLPARQLGLWLAPILLMGVIFALSAQPSLDSGLGSIDRIGRKFVHAGEYALLCVLWWRALRTRLRPGSAIAWAFAIAVAYAATDEYHQHFVEGRHGTPIDVIIDAAGAGIAAWWLHSHSRQGSRVEARA